MTADIHVRAERDARRIASGVGRGLPREVECPRDPIGIGADREGDPFGYARRELDHARARHCDVEWDLRLPAPIEPLQPARSAVAVNGFVGEIRLKIGDRVDESRDRHRRLAEVEHRGVAPTDAEHEPPVRRLLHRRRDVGERGRVAATAKLSLAAYRRAIGDSLGEP